MLNFNFMPQEEQTEVRPASQSFARCMKMVFEIDPMECPKCGETMKIIAFIHDSKDIEKIASSLGYPTWRSPPTLSAPGIRIDSGHEYSQILTR